MELLKPQSPRDLLELLRPTNVRWMTPPACIGAWCFRGHAKAEWELVPSLYRDLYAWEGHVKKAVGANLEQAERECGELLKTLSPDEKRRFAEARLLLNCEAVSVYEFIDIADSLGLVSPGLVLTDRANRLRLALEDEAYHESPTPDDGVALAQHHGIPTRLLDWTRSGLKALWFSASDAIMRQMDRGDISNCCIWAFCLFPPLSLSDLDLRVLNPPMWANPFLRAQSGIFTWDRRAEHHYIHSGKFRDQMRLLDLPIPFNGKPGLVKVEFPFKWSFELLELLRIEGIHLASLMPSLENVAHVVAPPWRNQVMARQLGSK